MSYKREEGGISEETKHKNTKSASHIEIWRKMHGIEKNIPLKKQLEKKERE